MHVRITTITGAQDIGRAVDHLHDVTLPEIRQQGGFRGLYVSGDRSAGVLVALSQWQNQRDLEASESTYEKARDEVLRAGGGQGTVERFEQAVWETANLAPDPGAKLHLTHVSMPPNRVDQNLVYFEETVVPEMRALTGFLGVRLLIDRATGEGRVGTLWADGVSHDAAMSSLREGRSSATIRGVIFGQERVLDFLFAGT